MSSNDYNQPINYPSILEGLAERTTSLTDQERGHLMDLARSLRSDDRAKTHAYSPTRHPHGYWCPNCIGLASAAAGAGVGASGLSDFIHNATPERKTEVYDKVMDKVTEQQRAVIEAGAEPMAIRNLRAVAYNLVKRMKSRGDYSGVDDLRRAVERVDRQAAPDLYGAATGYLHWFDNWAKAPNDEARTFAYERLMVYGDALLKAVESARGVQGCAEAQLLTDLKRLASEASDHTPDSFQKAVVRLANRAHTLTRGVQGCAPLPAEVRVLGPFAGQFRAVLEIGTFTFHVGPAYDKQDDAQWTADTLRRQLAAAGVREGDDAQR